MNCWAFYLLVLGLLALGIYFSFFGSPEYGAWVQGIAVGLAASTLLKIDKSRMD